MITVPERYREVVKQDLEKLAAEYGVEYDLLLIGDGSGSTSDKPCGWWVTAYNRRAGRVYFQAGATSGGTNNYAEIAPYLQALWHFDTTEPTPTKVLIISDSELTIRIGQGRYGRKANLGLWAQIDCYREKGYEINWRHVYRNTNRYSKLADKGANVVRLAIASEIERFMEEVFIPGGVSTSVPN